MQFTETWMEANKLFLLFWYDNVLDKLFPTNGCQKNWSRNIDTGKKRRRVIFDELLFQQIIVSDTLAFRMTLAVNDIATSHCSISTNCKATVHQYIGEQPRLGVTMRPSYKLGACVILFVESSSPIQVGWCSLQGKMIQLHNLIVTLLWYKVNSKYNLRAL